MKFFDLYDVFNAYYTEEIQDNIEIIRNECKDGLFEEIEPELMSAKEIYSDYEFQGCNVTVVETESYWLINTHTGLGYAQYPKDSFTLEEALQDQTNDEQ